MKYLVLASLFLLRVVKEPTAVVRVSSGLLRGTVSDNGRYHQYYGIPYATVGRANRFQAPLPPPTWNGVFEAINENNRCPQKMVFDLLSVGTEDCLKLNVYTPAVQSGQPYPVMVYIHGGCFVEGSSSSLLYGADHFVDNGVVLVTINYRLNVEGFLCLGIKEAPGNAGLKDQIAALKWIKKNIAAFGGDPHNVTLFGESAGAVSTSFLVLSPAAEGLFHKVILQSGSTVVPWGMQHDPIQTASDLAKEFGYYGRDPRRIYEVLSNKSVSELIFGIKYSEHRNYVTAKTIFAPCVEKDIPGVEAVIREYPVDVIKRGNYTKLPMISGYTDKEGIYFVGIDYGTSLKKFDPHELLYSDLVFPCEQSKNATAESLVKQYFSSRKDDLVMDMVELYSDVHVRYPVILETEMYMGTNDKPMYFYHFKYSGLVNLAKFVSRFIFTSGASHADELFYLFKPYVSPLNLQLLESNMVERMVTLWTNFAKYSDPTPTTSDLLPVKWQPSRKTNPSALIIDRQFSMTPLWGDTKISFWNRTYTKYRRRQYGFYTEPVANIHSLRSVSIR